MDGFVKHYLCDKSTIFRQNATKKSAKLLADFSWCFVVVETRRATSQQTND